MLILVKDTNSGVLFKVTNQQIIHPMYFNEKVVDLKLFLYGPIFETIHRNRTLFWTVHVDKELGTIVWDNGADIDPDVLIHERQPAWQENEVIHAREPIMPYRIRIKKK